MATGANNCRGAVRSFGLIAASTGLAAEIGNRHASVSGHSYERSRPPRPHETRTGPREGLHEGAVKRIPSHDL